MRSETENKLVARCRVGLWVLGRKFKEGSSAVGIRLAARIMHGECMDVFGSVVYN